MINDRWALFISGNGTTAQAALDCLSQTQVKLVVSSKKDAFGLIRARRSGVATLTLDSKINWSELQKALDSFRIQKIFLLGFMKIVPADFCARWQNRIFNVHPSLLPQFKGLNAIEKNFSAGSKMGVSIHHVTPDMDDGKLIYQHVSVAEPKNLQEAQIWTAFSEQYLIRQHVLKPAAKGVFA